MNGLEDDPGVLPTMDAKGVEVIVGCEGEFYSDPPEDHVERYKWVVERLAACSEVHRADGPLQWPVIDIGCGSGYGTAMLLDAGYNAIGLDRNPMAINFCDSRNVPAAVMDYPGTLFRPKEPWLAAVLIEVIEHSKDGMATLDRAMQDAFIVLASVPYDEPPGENGYHQLHHLTEQSFAWMVPQPTFTRLRESLLIEWRRP